MMWVLFIAYINNFLQYFSGFHNKHERHQDYYEEIINIILI